ncbi:MAG: hypothetical protein R2823_00150 [Acidimicrobiia bacterium]
MLNMQEHHIWDGPDDPPEEEPDHEALEYGPTDWGCTPIPTAIEDAEPGRRLANLLAGIDASTLSEYDQITIIQAKRRMVNHWTAQVLADIAEFIDTSVRNRHHTTVHGATVDAGAEVGVTLQLTRIAAAARSPWPSTFATVFPRCMT